MFVLIQIDLISAQCERLHLSVIQVSRVDSDRLLIPNITNVFVMVKISDPDDSGDTF